MNGNERFTPQDFDPETAPDLSAGEWPAKFARARVRRGRPPLATPKVSTTIRLSPDVLAHFKAGGRGWQTRINAALREWIRTYTKALELNPPDAAAYNNRGTAKRSLGQHDMKVIPQDEWDGKVAVVRQKGERFARDWSKKMPQNRTILQVFVSSPSDVAEERKILESVIKEINLTLSDTHTLRLELLKWETHARPGFGEDAQDVINQQIGDDYDIFLGIMWGRFGSPTHRAESGTEEEFNRALSRWKGSPERIQIMFYFKNAGIPPSELDPEQLAQVQAFKKKISSQGVYSEFQDAEDFRTQARRHLTKVIQDWRKRALSDGDLFSQANLDYITDAINEKDHQHFVQELESLYPRLRKYGLLTPSIEPVRTGKSEYDGTWYEYHVTFLKALRRQVRDGTFNLDQWNIDVQREDKKRKDFLKQTE